MQYEHRFATHKPGATMWRHVAILTNIHSAPLPVSNISATVVIFIFTVLALYFYPLSSHVRMTRLKGPPRGSFIYGINKAFMKMPDRSRLYEHWAEVYGPVYQLPWTLGSRFVVLSDPRAVAHFFTQSSWKYHQLRELKLFTQSTVSVTDRPR
jgi:hypothetical protein